MTDQDSMLTKIRALLAKAEAEGCTPPEAEALTAKAAELMAKYGIDQAKLAAERPGTDYVMNSVIEIPNPWARVRSHLLGGIVLAMRGQAIRLRKNGTTVRLHIFGYCSDLDRAELLYTSLLVQAARGLAAELPPWNLHGPQLAAWRRSWMLGFASVVIRRVQDAETRASQQAAEEDTPGSTSTALVLADRSLAVRNGYREAYPKTIKARITTSGQGYGNGRVAGQRADIGGTRVGSRGGRAISQ
jgi:Protein of unknown function (DUF2786)